MSPCLLYQNIAFNTTPTKLFLFTNLKTVFYLLHLVRNETSHNRYNKYISIFVFFKERFLQFCKPVKIENGVVL